MDKCNEFSNNKFSNEFTNEFTNNEFSKFKNGFTTLNNGLTNINTDVKKFNFSFGLDDFSSLGKLKNEFRENLEILENYLKNEPKTEQEWESVLNYKNNFKSRLNEANSQVSRLLKQWMNSDSVKYLQVQRYSSIFDQLTTEFNNCSRQIDTRYQRFILFSSPDKYYKEENTTKITQSGMGLVDAIMDVESLTGQASQNLELLKRGNRKLLKIYNRVNTMVNKHLFDVQKLQKNINFIMTRNRAIFSIIIGIFLFFIFCKIFLKFI
uniref:Uncharacterized protein n=1 Tax=Theileria annulata TaxID=5874 RepID=A0A3B0NJX3_THEAN